MSIIRAILVLLAGYGHHITLTPPQSANVSKEDEVFRRKELIIASIVLPFSKIYVWSAAATDALVNLSTYLNSLQPSLNILEQARTLLSAFCSSNPAQLQSLAITPAFLLCMTSVLSGAAIRQACYRALGRFFTFVHTSRDSHKLITTGPYSVVRHPGYTGLLLVKLGTIGWLLLDGSWMMGGQWLGRGATWWQRTLLFVYIGWSTLENYHLVVVRTRKEDESLRKLSPEEWDEYQKRVSYRCIPYIF